MFRCSICDPLKKDIIEVGEIPKEKVLDILDQFPWTEMTNKMKGLKPEEICWSPSIEFENKDNRNGVSISVVDDGNEFYIFFKRPKRVKKLFGLIEKLDENFSSDRTGQTISDAREAVIALLNDDELTLERRWG